MDKFKLKASSARNRVAERTSRGTGSGSLAVPHSTLPPDDNASTVAVNEGQLGTAARDFAVPADQPAHQPVVEPPTSLQSSVDAGKAVPVPARGSSKRTAKDGSRLQGPRRKPTDSAGRQPPPPSNRPQMGARNPSIGIRRCSSAQGPQQAADAQNASPTDFKRAGSPLPALDETCALGEVPSNTAAPPSSTTQQRQAGWLKRNLTFGKGKERDTEAGSAPASAAPPNQPREYAANMVDVLDTLDPEVQTLTSLTNVQNSLFIPNLGRFVNRRPTYTIRQTPSEQQGVEEVNAAFDPVRHIQEQEEPAPSLARAQSTGTMATLATIDSNLSDSRYAVLPHGTDLEGWSKEDKKELNDHVRHMLHSKRSKFKRSMKGFGQYVRRPLGFLVTLYATLITLFGLAWVLFLIGWINVGGRQIYVVHIIDSVLVALFAIVGDGLAPFRAVDTYHMIYIAHYHHFTWTRRKKELLPDLQDHNDLPTSNAPISGPRVSDSDDPEKQQNWEFTVLSPKQQAKLEHHQAKFSKSHSFYKPHETETHHAFPLRLLIAIVVLLDCHSLLQISLGACTWGIYYKVRPFALTTVILCCSITCNATAGLLILIGDRRTRKKDVLERMNRQELTEEAIQIVEEKKKEKESESEREDNDEASKRRTSLDVFRKPLHNKSHKSGEQSAYP